MPDFCKSKPCIKNRDFAIDKTWNSRQYVRHLFCDLMQNLQNKALITQNKVQLFCMHSESKN